MSDINRWVDRSGKNLHATNTDINTQPGLVRSGLTGRNIVTFDSSELSVPSLNLQSIGWTIFAVASLSENSSANARLLSLLTTGTPDTESWVVIRRDSSNSAVLSAQGAGNTNSVSINYGEFNIFCSVITATGLELYVNGELLGATSGFTPAALNSTGGMKIGRALGSNEYWNGAIAEVLVLPLLDVGQRATTEGILAHRFGLTVKLSNSWMKPLVPSRLGFFRRGLNEASYHNLSTDTATTFGNFSGINKWVGGVLAPNGMIYGIPFSSTSILRIDPNTNTATTFGNFSGGNAWDGGVLAPNGMIYGIPSSSTSILRIDPNTNTATTFGNFSGTNKWVGGVLAPNGMIYGIPSHSTSILRIDPNTNTATTFGNFSSDLFKWYGGILAPNGMIYGIPDQSASILRIDPNTNTATTFGSVGGGWSGGVLAPNGMIYGIPSQSASILRIDPNTNTATTFGNFSEGGKWYGGVLAPNGMIYGIPLNSTSILRIDPNTNTATTFGNFSGGAECIGGVLAPNGMIYGIPHDSTSILRVLNETPVDDLLLSAYVNKL